MHLRRRRLNANLRGWNSTEPGYARVTILYATPIQWRGLQSSPLAAGIGHVSDSVLSPDGSLAPTANRKDYDQ